MTIQRACALAICTVVCMLCFNKTFRVCVCVCVVVLVPAFLPGVGGDSKSVLYMAMTSDRQTTLEDTRHHRAGGLVHGTGGRETGGRQGPLAPALLLRQPYINNFSTLSLSTCKMDTIVFVSQVKCQQGY